MDGEGQDLHRTLEYRATTSIARLLPTGLLLIFIGLSLLVLADANDKPASRGHYLFIALAVTLGLGVIAVALRARSRPGRPVFTLSPAGIGHRWVRQVLIPWHEVQAIERADIVTRLFNPVSLFSSGSTLLYRTSLFPDVTVIVVSRQFYEAVLHVNSFWLRGPGWKGNFIPCGDTVQVALHHELVAADRQQLRQAVTSRWLAFRDRATGRGMKTVPAAGRSSIASEVVAMGDDPRTLSRFQRLQIAVLLAGIAAAGANLAGLWQLDGQGAARLARAKVLDERRDREAARVRMQEEAKRRAAEDKRRQEENEEVLRRAFGR